MNTRYSSFKLQDDGLGNEFTNLWVGIDYVNSIRNPVKQNFVNCDFGSVAYGIILRGGNGVLVRECNFMIDPSFAYSNKAVPKSFIGINARGSINFTVTENIFSDGYCGVLVANASRMNSLIYKNTFLGVGKRSKGKGQGVYSWGSNILQVSCNTFSSSATDLVQNHIVSNGALPSQGACREVDDENKRPANNRFEGAQPFNADVYALQEETGFLYYVENTQVPVITPLYKEGSANMTSVYVWNCNGQYQDLPSCPSLTFDETRPLTELVDSLEAAMQTNNQEKIEWWLTKALSYYYQSDSTGLESIRLLNETPNLIAKWMLTARYLASEKYQEAFMTLSLLPNSNAEEQDEKTLYELMLLLETDSLSFLDTTGYTLSTLKGLAYSSTATSEEAKGILHYLRGDGFLIPLPCEESAEAPILITDSTQAEVTTLTLIPNPSNENFGIRFSNDLVLTKISISSIDGSILQSYPVDSKSYRYDVSTLPEGLYLVLIEAQNGNKYSQKLSVQR